MLIALRKEHLQDTEPFLRAFRFGSSKISIQPHTLIIFIMHKAIVLLIVLNEYSSNMYAW